LGTTLYLVVTEKLVVGAVVSCTLGSGWGKRERKPQQGEEEDKTEQKETQLELGAREHHKGSPSARGVEGTTLYWPTRQPLLVAPSRPRDELRNFDGFVFVKVLRWSLDRSLYRRKQPSQTTCPAGGRGGLGSVFSFMSQREERDWFYRHRFGRLRFARPCFSFISVLFEFSLSTLCSLSVSL
jgi:hypothetical protein